MSSLLAPGDTTCHTCGHGLVPQREWAAATEQHRHQWTTQGLRRAGSRSLCTICTEAERREHQPRHPCPRCGRPRTTRSKRPTATGLCRDCMLVTADLGERERWAS